MPTRRRVLQYGLAAVAGVLPGPPSGRPPSTGADALLCLLPQSTPLATAAATSRGFAGFAAAPHTARLVLPPVARPVRADAAGDAYAVEIRTASVPLVPGGEPASLLTYDGTWPGPTIHAQVGRPVEVTFHNRLDRPAVVHLHGAHTGPESDGHPSDEIAPGASRTYRYPNRQAAATLWYHDHVMHRTGEQVYRGLAGLYLLRDPAEDALGLPSGDRDLPLLLADRRLDADGRPVYDHNSHGGAFGDVVFVNGVAHPVHGTDAAPLRLRLLNGSNSRIYDLRFDDAAVRMLQVASDGGLLAAPVERTSIRLAPAERVDVVVDLSAVAGRTVHLVDAAALEGTPTLVRFEVGGGATPAVLPATLGAITDLGVPALTREVRLSRTADGHWQLNDANFDPARIDYRPRLDVTERWRITNDTLTPHPVHLHLAQFRVQTRGGAPVPPEERDWKDTVLVPGRGVVELLVRFTGHTGTFVYHCHNLEHEDHDMMAQFRVVALQRLAGGGRLETAAAISSEVFRPGVPVAVVATAGGFADALSGGPAAALLGGPVLLTSGTTLADATREELRRLAPGRILVLGGERAVPASVEQELRALTGGPVERLAGPDRFATAAAVSAAVFPAPTSVVYLATGADFPDALAGGAGAAAERAPVLLVTRDGVPAQTRAELSRLAPQAVRVMGGPGAVGDAVLDEVRALTGAEVTRLAGQDRFATAVSVSSALWPGGSEVVVVATAGGFPDALAGVPAAGALGAPLLLVTRDGVPPAVAAELRRLDPSRIVVLGGPGAVGPAAVSALDAVLEGA